MDSDRQELPPISDIRNGRQFIYAGDYDSAACRLLGLAHKIAQLW